MTFDDACHGANSTLIDAYHVANCGTCHQRLLNHVELDGLGCTVPDWSVISTVQLIHSRLLV